MKTDADVRPMVALKEEMLMPRTRSWLSEQTWSAVARCGAA